MSKFRNPSVLFAFLLVILGGYWVRIVDLNTGPPGINYDQARNYIRSWRVAHGHGFNWLFDDIPEPFDALIRGLLMAVAGDSIFVARLLTVLLGTIAVAATIAVARELFRTTSYPNAVAAIAGSVYSTMPMAIGLTRGIYRTNWVAPMVMLAMLFALRAMRTKKTHWYVLTGIFTALSSMFYLAGLVAPVAIGSMFVLHFLQNRKSVPPPRTFLFAAMAFLITFSPWLYLYIWINGWLSYRVDSVSSSSYIIDVDNMTREAENIAALIVFPADDYPDKEPFWGAHYSVFREPILHVGWLVLLGLGILAMGMRRKQNFVWFPMLGFTVLLIPALMADTSGGSRFKATLPILALMVSGGSWLVFRAMARWLPKQQHVVIWSTVMLLGGLSLINTHQAFQYHYQDEPLLWDTPLQATGADWNWNIRINDAIEFALAQDKPVYFPEHILQYAVGSAYLRAAGVQLASFEGDTLPAGIVFAPEYTESDPLSIPPPNGYVLIDPIMNTAAILPPFSDNAHFADIDSTVRNNGTPIQDSRDWPLGYTLVTNEIDGFLAAFSAYPAPDSTPLTIYNDNLELLGVDMPTHTSAGEALPVTFYWRLKNNTQTDYFAFVSLVQNEINRRGGQIDTFSGIHRYLYPTSQWQAGEIVADTRWVYVFDDAPNGGYRIALDVHNHPNTRTADVDTTYGARQRNNDVIVGQTWIQSVPFPTPNETATPFDLQFSQDIGQITLTHMDTQPPISEITAGQTLDLRFYWEAQTTIAEDYSLFVHIVDANDNIVAQLDTAFWEEGFPTSTWYVGARVTIQRHVIIPADEQGPFRLRMGLYFVPTLERLQVSNADGFEVVDNAVFITDSPQ